MDSEIKLNSTYTTNETEEILEINNNTIKGKPKKKLKNNNLIKLCKKGKYY